jgi:hypothetical protein
MPPASGTAEAGATTRDVATDASSGGSVRPRPAVSLADRVSNSFHTLRVVCTNAEGLLSRAAHLAHPTFTARV